VITPLSLGLTRGFVVDGVKPKLQALERAETAKEEVLITSRLRRVIVRSVDLKQRLYVS